MSSWDASTNQLTYNRTMEKTQEILDLEREVTRLERLVASKKAFINDLLKTQKNLHGQIKDLTGLLNEYKEKYEGVKQLERSVKAVKAKTREVKKLKKAMDENKKEDQ